jgi:hypothetical protein
MAAVAEKKNIPKYKNIKVMSHVITQGKNTEIFGSSTIPHEASC